MYMYSCTAHDDVARLFPRESRLFWCMHLERFLLKPFVFKHKTEKQKVQYSGCGPAPNIKGSCARTAVFGLRALHDDGMVMIV